MCPGGPPIRGLGGGPGLGGPSCEWMVIVGDGVLSFGGIGRGGGGIGRGGGGIERGGGSCMGGCLGMPGGPISEGPIFSASSEGLNQS